MTVKQIIFQSIPVDDQDRALQFYTENLGFDVHTDAPYGDGWRWIFLNLPGAQTRLHFATRDDMQINEKPALALECDSVDRMATALGDAGVTITSGPDDAPWAAGVRWLMIRDSEDNLILLESFSEDQ